MSKEEIASEDVKHRVFFLRFVKGEKLISEGTKYRALSNSIKSLAELNLMEKDFYFNW